MGVVRDAIPESWRARPMRVLAPALGGVAIVYVGVAIAAMNTHPEEKVVLKDAALVRLEATLLVLGQIGRGVDLASVGGSAVGADRSMDADGDGRITTADLRLRFQELAEKARVDGATGFSLADYVRLGGSPLWFDELDVDDDGRVVALDVVRVRPGQQREAVIANGSPKGEVKEQGTTESNGAKSGGSSVGGPMEWEGVKTTDPRNGFELELDPVRAGWLQEMVALDTNECWRWRGNAIPVAEFGTGSYGVLTLMDQSTVKCFLQRDVGTKVARIVDDEGKVRELTFGSATAEIRSWAEIPDQSEPAKMWYAAMVTMVTRKGASDSAGWAGLALALRGKPGMAHETEDAAKRALIYDPSLKELWPIVGVERKGKQLVRKVD